MRTNQIFRITAVAILMAISVPALSNTNIAEPGKTTMVPVAEDARAHQLMQRLEEIKTMDKSTLSREEKKALRKEVKATRKDMREHYHYVYISVGAAFIIILLLILIL